MNFVFTATDNDGTVTTKTFTTEYLPSVIEGFDAFVRGCGFFPKGTIDDVEEEKEIPYCETKNPEDFADFFFSDT